MIYFTADLHFGHQNIIKYCNRPFMSVQEMDDALTRNWNDVVSSRDEVYILGDLTMKAPEEAHAYLCVLNGRKYFIRGNHDKFLRGFTPYESDFVWIKDYYTLKHNGQKIVLFHYPICEWDGFFRGSIHLYGHIHNSTVSAKRTDAMSGLAFNVGVDCNNYRPISIEEVMLMAGKVSSGS